MDELIVLLLFCRVVCPVLHSLEYFYITSCQVPNFPEFVVVGLVDDVQMFHYDSNTQRAEPKQAWMSKVTADDPEYWESQTAVCVDKETLQRSNIETAKQRFNQTGGVHVSQQMFGCEWDDETGDIKGFHQSGYDGEDFLVLDLQTLTWIAPVPQAVLTKHRLDPNTAHSERWKRYLTKDCVHWLKKYLDYGKNILNRTILPSVYLLQKSPSSPLSCYATGFYPNRAQMFWIRDGEEVHEGVEPGQILPNHDGSFQKSVDLDISSIRAEDWQTYKCVFQLSGVKEPKVTVLDHKRIRTNWGRPRPDDGEFPAGRVMGGIAVLLILVVCIVAFYRWRRNHHGL
ncbi:class I histocompatibility antigen, F10 alpha chain-like isoform X2 [Genypterus blacodes]|uniref:class I histocompatibility antigen, F10 alpha chain-like isoform X2 n=1 Tax=Genypterus blacodes TaxID=154954 RepID=UPI003F761637